MVGHHDGAGSSLQSLLRPGHGHNTLEDKGALRPGGDLLQLLHGLAAGGGLHVLQEGQARGVDVHGDGKGIGGLYQLHLLPHQLHVPGLDGGHAAAAVFRQHLRRGPHHVVVGAVTGEGGNPRRRAGGNQDLVVLQVVVLVAVVLGHRPHGGREHRQGQLPPEELTAGVHGAVFADGVHVHTQLLPLLVVADGAGAQALGPGTWNGISAGHTVADGAGLAVGPHAGACRRQNFLIGHSRFSFRNSK